MGAFVINMQSIEGLSSHYCNQRWSVVAQLSLNFLNKSQVVFINSSLKKKQKMMLKINSTTFCFSYTSTFHNVHKAC